MANYPYMNYQQPMMNYQQPMQQMQPQGNVFCRAVTSIEEARGVPVDFSGGLMVFPDTAHGRIYTKVFNPATGAAELVAYERATQDEPQFAPMQEVMAIKQQLASVMAELENMKYRKGNPNEPDYPDDYERNAARRRSYEDDFQLSAKQPATSPSDGYYPRKKRAAVGTDSPEYGEGTGR